jgi:predicted O-linked N-acetylglucosamine transferase (SPINDLY family)
MSQARAQALLQQALAHHQAGRVPAAAGLYAQVRTLMPRSFEAHHLGGAAALQLNRPHDAEKLLRRALALNPKSAATLMCLGLAQAALGQLPEAEKNLCASLQLDPKNHEAWVHFASVQSIGGRLDDAVASYERCLKLKPTCVQALTGLGSVLQLKNRSLDALALHTRALVLEPHHPKARSSRAQSYQSLHRLEEALADFDTHLAHHPDDLEARSYRLLGLNYSAGLTREELFAEHLAFGRHAAAAAKKQPAPPAPIAADPRPGDGRLSVAFLSPDLRTHAVACFLEPLLRHLDPARFAITLYHDHFVTDAVSQRLRAHAVRWRNFIGATNDVVESQIRADAPDLLVDLAGHTGFNRLPLFARRLAPVQISYLGYPNTTGLAEMDFRLTDALADPPGESDAFHTEQLVRFAPTAWAYQPPAEAPAPALTPSSLGAPFTFGSFNNLSKINAATLRLWGDILRAAPGSRLLLKSFGLTADTLRPLLDNALIDPARVDLLTPTAGIAEHLALYARIDVALDPFPYHGTTTTCEALWMGVPVITLAGDRHAARVGVSLLNAAGHPELIASGPADYVRIATQLAADPARLAGLHARLRTDMENSPLLAHAAQAARFADALTACWENRLAAPAAALATAP